MLANPTVFGLTGTTSTELENEVWEDTEDIKKTEFALNYSIDEKNWNVPLYIKEGLEWLAQNPNVALTPPAPAVAVTPSTMDEEILTPVTE
jgi:putative ATP-dependent endonuclease of OLD family